MKQLIKRLCSAVILAMLMRPGLDAAPQKGVSSVNVEAKTIHVPLLHPPANHIDELKGPGYDVHVHDYHPPPIQHAPQIYKDSVVDMLKYLEKTFHFIQVVDKDDHLATDLVDESWYGWLNYWQQIMPIVSQYTVHANDIENPHEDAPGSLWDSLLYLFLKRSHVVKVDRDKHGNNNNVEYTSIAFDPIGQLFDKGWGLIKEYSGYESFGQWWKRLQFEFEKSSAFEHEKLKAEEVKTEEEDGVHLPEGVLTIARYDPLVLGVNTILFIGFHALFWATYLPVSGVTNLLEDYPDIDPDEYENGESADDVPPEGDYEDGDYAEGDYAEGDYAEGDYAEGDYAEGDYAEGDYAEGDYEGDGRRDYYDYHSSYTGYQHYDRIDPGDDRIARTHVGEGKKDSLSSNHYSHGAVGPHEAYSLNDGNIYVKKRK